MASAAHRQIIGGGGAPINKSRRRPQIVGGGSAAVHSSSTNHDRGCEYVEGRLAPINDDGQDV